MKIQSIIYCSDTLSKIDEMLQSDEVETCKLALGMCLQELPDRVLNYNSEWLYENFKNGSVKDIIKKGIACDDVESLYKYCWAIHLTLMSFKTVLTKIV